MKAKAIVLIVVVIILLGYFTFFQNTNFSGEYVIGGVRGDEANPGPIEADCRMVHFSERIYLIHRVV